ncbi:MAG: alpha/beta hydrolase [Chloroflexota bacterium]
MKTSPFYPFRSAQAQAEYLALYLERAKAWPVASETKLVETPSGQTFVRISGRPTDPPLVLLHGARGNSLMWIPNIAALSAHYRTCALDSINDTGLSVSRRSVTKPEGLVNWLDEVLAVLVPEGRLSLVGMSYGGWLASQYALRFPKRLHKVVLLAPAATVLPVSFALIVRALLTIIPRTDFRKRFYYWLLHDMMQSGEAGRAWVDEVVADWEVAERCFGPLPTVALPVIADQVLSGLMVPALFLVGENEKVYSAQKAVRRLNRVAPQIKTEIIPQAGHDLWIAQTEVVTGKMLDFLLAV